MSSLNRSAMANSTVNRSNRKMEVMIESVLRAQDINKLNAMIESGVLVPSDSPDLKYYISSEIYKGRGQPVKDP